MARRGKPRASLRGLRNLWLVVAMVLPLVASYVWAVGPDGSPVGQVSKWTELTLPDDIGSVDAAVSSALLEPASRDAEAEGGSGGFIWLPRRDMPTPRNKLGVVAGSNGKIYAIGGSSSDLTDRLATAEEYDPSANVWRSLASMGFARNLLGLASTISGKIYAVGGCCADSVFYMPIPVIEEYDSANDTWTYRTTLPTARRGAAVVAVDNSIFVIGGLQSGSGGSDRYLSVVEEYNPLNNTWRTRARMPTARYRPRATVRDGKIYVLGGDGDGKPSLRTFEEYDPVSDTWTALHDMPVARSAMGIVASGGKLYVLGGVGLDGSLLSSIDVYNPQNGTWAASGRMSSARADFEVVAVNEDSFYVIGGATVYGWNGTNSVANVEIAAPIRNYLNLPFAATTYRAPVEEDFSSVESGWPVGESEVSSVGYSDGGYRMLVKEEGYIVTAGPDLRAANLRVEVDALAAVHTKGAYGLFFGSNSSGFYAFQLRDSTFTLRRYDRLNNTWTTLLSTQSNSAIRWRVNESNHLKVARDGSQISLYVNEQAVGYVPDTAPEEGYMGFAASGYEPNYEARFDNFSLTYLSPGLAAPTPAPTQTPTPSPTANPIPGALVFSAVSSMPTKRTKPGVATTRNGKIFAIGGYNETSQYLTAVEEYDPSADTWTPRANLAVARGSMGALATSNDRVFAVGGSNFSGAFATVEEYDPASNAWGTRSSMPTARSQLAVVELDGRIYAMGGSGSRLLNTVEVYDLDTDVWTALPSMPMAVFGPAAVSPGNGRIYVTGGPSSDPDSEAITMEFDPKTGNWHELPRLRGFKVYWSRAAAMNGNVYILGSSGSSSAPVVAEYNPATTRWRTLAPTTALPYLPAFAGSGGTLYSLGGYFPGPGYVDVAVGTVLKASVP